MSKQEKELHLFMPVGDDEIQVESWDRKFNKEVLKLHEKEPDAVVILYDDDAPAFLRAAVKMENFSFSVHPSVERTEPTYAQKKARSENGKKAVANNNLKNVNN